MPSIKADVPTTPVTAKTKKFNNGESARFFVMFTDDHDKLKSKGPYGQSRDHLEARDYTIPALYATIPAKVSGDKVDAKWPIKWDKFKRPLAQPGGAGFDEEGLSATDCEIYSVLRAEYRYLDDGFKKLPSKYDAVHGLDGLFQSGKRYVVVESKFVTPAKYRKYCKGNSPLPHLGWKKDPEEDPDMEAFIRQLSWAWVSSSFEQMEEEGRDAATRRTGADMQAVARKNMTRVLNVFGARPVHPPPGAYGFKLRVTEKNGKTKDVTKKKSDGGSLKVDWNPSWLISGKPYGKEEFWILDQKEDAFIYAQREDTL